MATPEQLAQQIRFGLDTLGERNAHHDFEHLCRGVATKRIISNLLPATGPVSSGGDQGRDSETFWTHLPVELPNTSLFVALASSDRVVLACTTQRESLPTKIRSDLSTICSQGSTVNRVIVFCTLAVPVSLRHTLQREARREHDIELDVWDAVALAEQLAQPDIFYLAVQYLHLPSELAPSAEPSTATLPSWYVTDRERWRGRTTSAGTFGEFIDLQGCLRHATFNPPARADIGEWLQRMYDVLGQSPSTDIRLRARYEIAVATLRGTDTLRPADSLVQEFFAEVNTAVSDPGILEDAVVLLQYCQGAFARALTDMTADNLVRLHHELASRVATLLDDEPYPNRRASLLALSARLALQPDMAVMPQIDPIDLARPSEVMEQVLEALDNDRPVQMRVRDISLADRDGGMTQLVRLCEALDEAPLFPVETIADYFDLLSPLLTEHPLYRQVRDALDDAADKVAGHAARADRCRGRAIQMLEAGQRLAALAEIHDAKVNWWSGDTLDGSILAMLLAAEIYSNLGLPLAAKQYAMTAAWAAQSSGQPHLIEKTARGILLAASYDYQAGSWLSATFLFKVGIMAHSSLAEQPWDQDQHPHFQDMLVHQAMIVLAAQQIRTDLVSTIQDAMATTGVNTLVGPMVEEAERLRSWPEEQWAKNADASNCGRPFSDVGPSRRYTWTAFGIRWFVSARNDRNSVMAAERLVAGAQIVAVELERHDPVLLRGDIYIDTETYSTGQRPAETCEPIPDNHASTWRVHLAVEEALDPAQFHVELMSMLAVILLNSSLLPKHRFFQILDAAYSEGLGHKLSIGRPYDEVAGILRDDTFAVIADHEARLIGAEIPLRPDVSVELEPTQTPGPGYTRDAAVEALNTRYRRLPLIAQHTLPRLLNDPSVRSTLARLRAQGWLDWHLLTAIANIVANQRIAREGVSLPPQNRQEAARASALMSRPEATSDPIVPPEQFTEAALTHALQISAISTVNNLGLESHQRTPQFAAIFDLLGTRYGYWTDDVPHPDFFMNVGDAVP
jgi:hypothetical protein